MLKNKFILFTVIVTFFCDFTLHSQNNTSYQVNDSFKPFNNNISRQFTVQTPIQNGTARRSNAISTAGLYQIDDTLLDKHNKIYNAGIELPILRSDNKKFVFVRRINDFYNKNNYIWLGLLNIQIPPYLGIEKPNPIPFASQQNGWIDYDGYDGYLKENGLTRIYSFNNDRNYTSHSAQFGGLSNGPNWYNGSVTETVKDFNISTPHAKIDEKRMAKVVIAINDLNSSKETKRSLEVNINDNYDHRVIIYYTGYGCKLFEIEVSAKLFNSGDKDLKNKITINKIDSFENPSPVTYNLDFINLHLPIVEEGLNQDEGYNLGNIDSATLFNLHVSPNLNTTVRISNNAKYLVDVTTMGNESIIASNIEEKFLSFNIKTDAEKDKSIFVSSLISPCNFGEPKVLDTIGLNGYDYLTVAPSDPNYFLQLSTAKIFSHMKSSYSSNLFKTWTEYKPNRGNKTISDLHREEGLKPLNLKLEDIIDTYGCGIYSPHAIQQLIRTSNEIKYLVLLGMTTVDYKGQSVNQKLANEDGYTFYMCYPGVPTGFMYQGQSGFFASDDIYVGDKNESVDTMGELKRSLSRILVYTDKELSAWLDKRFNFKPSDNMALWSGKDDSNFSFSEKQRTYRDKRPSVFLNHNEFDTLKLQNSIKAATNGGVNMHIYQGHGVGYQLDNVRFLHTDDAVVTAPANYIFGTCHVGDFVKTGAVPKLKGTVTNLSYSYTNAKRSDSSDIICTIDQEADSTKGAVNIISASSYAAAVWENDFISTCMDLTKENPNITWGEMIKEAKSRIYYGVNAMMYHLFGDPALKVFDNTVRTITWADSKYTGKKMNFLVKGNWKKTQPIATTINYTINYTTTSGSKGEENGSFDISNYTHEQLLEGVIVSFNINSIPNQSNLVVNFYSNFDLKIQAGANTTETITMDWTKTSESIVLDNIAPSDFKVISPSGNKTIEPININLKANETKDLLSGVAGYRFFITHKASKKVFTSGDKLLTTPSFTFDPMTLDTTNSVKLRDCTGSFSWHCVAYDLANNEKISGPPFASTSDFTWRSDDDTDNDGIADWWEMYYYGDINFSNGTTDSSGSGLSDYEKYQNEIHPYNFTLKLYRGWNMVALPCVLADDYLGIYDEINKNADIVYYYDAEKQIYVEIEEDLSNTNAPQVGLWVFMLTELEPATFTGKPLNKATLLKPKWNLIGSMGAPSVGKIIDPTNDLIFKVNSDENNQIISNEFYIQMNQNELLLPPSAYWYYNANGRDRSIFIK